MRYPFGYTESGHFLSDHRRSLGQSAGGKRAGKKPPHHAFDTPVLLFDGDFVVIIEQRVLGALMLLTKRWSGTDFLIQRLLLQVVEKTGQPAE